MTHRTSRPCWVSDWAGAVASPVNTRFDLEELEYTLSDPELSALLGLDTFKHDAAELNESIEKLHEQMSLLLDRDGSFVAEEFITR